MADNCVVDDGDVANAGIGGVRRGHDTGDRRLENKVVSDNRVRDDLDPFTAVPHGIALDYVSFRSAAVNEDAWVFLANGGVVDDVIADDVAIGADFNLNPVIAAVA